MRRKHAAPQACRAGRGLDGRYMQMSDRRSDHRPPGRCRTHRSASRTGSPGRERPCGPSLRSTPPQRNHTRPATLISAQAADQRLSTHWLARRARSEAFESRGRAWHQADEPSSQSSRAGKRPHEKQGGLMPSPRRHGVARRLFVTGVIAAGLGAGGAGIASAATSNGTPSPSSSPSSAPSSSATAHSHAGSGSATAQTHHCANIGGRSRGSSSSGSTSSTS